MVNTQMLPQICSVTTSYLELPARVSARHKFRHNSTSAYAEFVHLLLSPSLGDWIQVHIKEKYLPKLVLRGGGREKVPRSPQIETLTLSSPAID